MENNQQEETVKERIINLLQKGYRRPQLIHDLGFAERTVDAAIKTYKELYYDDAGGAALTEEDAVDDEAAPQSKNEGKGTSGPKGRDGALAIRKEKESILPEWLGRNVAEIFDGCLRDQRIFLAGISVPLMGLRLFAEASKPTIELLATWQKGQIKAARAAQGSGAEIAEAAAAGAAARATMHIDQKFEELKESKKEKADIATVPDPMKGLMARTMEMLMNQVTGLLLGKQEAGNSNPGLVDKRTEMSMGQ